MKPVGSFHGESVRIDGRGVEEGVLRRHLGREEVGLNAEGWVVGF